MKVDAVMLLLLDSETDELSLAAYRGVSRKFVENIDTLRIGEGFNGMVAQTGESMYVEDASTDPRLTKKVVIEEGLRSEFIVPLKSKGRVMGTLCVANRRQCDFKKEERKTLEAIGNQIGVVLENARLFERERDVAKKLRISEERYRQLFENANDAIWINDIDGNIISANDAAVKLVGYKLENLSYSNHRSLLSEDSLKKANEIRTKLLRGEPVEQPYEQTLVMADGTEKIIRLMTNVFKVDGKPVGFQHIARDVTQQIHMQENLRFYLEHFTKAQEEERMRIAHELHDDTIQALVVLSRELDMLALSKEGIAEDKKLRLENLRQQTNNIMAGVRRLSQDLRPPILDRLGLWAALEWLASNLENRAGISVGIKKKGKDRRLASEAELLFFRIVQEALNNVWRHSQATHAEVTVEFGKNVTRITIKDNGKGFNIPYPEDELTRRGKLGVAGMKERASLMGGKMEVDSTPDKGTTITVEAPV
jgi:PAS domain S-box-containing protein